MTVTIEGEKDDRGGSGREIDVQAVFGGLGIAIAAMALLFLLFVFLRRTPLDERVMMELEEAQDLYEEDMASIGEDFEGEIEDEG